MDFRSVPHHGLCTKKHLLATASIVDLAMANQYAVFQRFERVSLVPRRTSLVHVNVRILVSIHLASTSILRRQGPAG
jgi:hypothetical protein